MPDTIINDTMLHYEDHGTGVPVVLIHGFPLDSRMWEAQMQGLSGQYRVITPDLRGFGRSGNSRPFTIESLADDVHALLAQIKALPCVLGGLSMGGYVAFAHVTKYPTDLQGLMLIDTKCEADTSEAKQNRMKLIETARRGGAKAVADQMLPKLLAPQTQQNKPELVRRIREMIESCAVQTIEQASLAMRDRRDYRDELPSIPVPTLAVVGEDDALSPPALTRSMCGEIPRAKVVTIPQAGHLSPLEQPEAVNAAIREFLESLGRTP